MAATPPCTVALLPLTPRGGEEALRLARDLRALGVRCEADGRGGKRYLRTYEVTRHVKPIGTSGCIGPAPHGQVKLATEIYGARRLQAGLGGGKDQVVKRNDAIRTEEIPFT